MSVKTTADEMMDRIERSAMDTFKEASKLYSDRPWGHDRYDPEDILKVLDRAAQLQLQVRRMR